MTDPAQPADQTQPAEPGPPAEPAPPSSRRPGRLVLAAAALGLLATGGVGGFVAGHATAGGGDDGVSVVDRSDDDGQFPGTPPGLDGERGDFPGMPSDQDQSQDRSGSGSDT